MKKVLVLLLALAATPAMAQTKLQSTISTALSNLADIDGAVALSTSIPGLQDPVGNACWSSLAGVQALIKAHPLPLTLKAASDFEALRLATIALNQMCANPNCGQMWQDVQNTAASIAGLPIPVSLAAICSKVPIVPVTVAAPAATPSVTK